MVISMIVNNRQILQISDILNLNKINHLIMHTLIPNTDALLKK